tara:strand:+ start:406 stop:1038 length:633 start_codon:yes stop_codon:yes gene_type:complete
MNFKKDNFIVIKKTISEELSNFVYRYFLLKRKVADTLYKNKYVPNNSPEWGVWNDQQVPNTYSHYSDIVMETLLLDVQPIMEKLTELQLVPTYSYARIYKKGDILHRHKDRPSCEISTTLNLGGDSWPIFLEPSGQLGEKGIKIDLEPGDMLVYSGCILEHWREQFEGENCGQVFLHYNNLNSQHVKNNKFDGREHLGLPSFCTKLIIRH